MLVKAIALNFELVTKFVEGFDTGLIYRHIWWMVQLIPKYWQRLCQLAEDGVGKGLRMGRQSKGGVCVEIGMWS